jgi:hypothetical protein
MCGTKDTGANFVNDAWKQWALDDGEPTDFLQVMIEA